MKYVNNSNWFSLRGQRKRGSLLKGAQKRIGEIVIDNHKLNFNDRKTSKHKYKVRTSCGGKPEPHSAAMLNIESVCGISGRRAEGGRWAAFGVFAIEINKPLIGADRWGRFYRAKEWKLPKDDSALWVMNYYPHPSSAISTPYHPASNHVVMVWDSSPVTYFF